jgi:hypothetical protein
MVPREVGTNIIMFENTVSKVEVQTSPIDSAKIKKRMPMTMNKM